MFEKIKKFLKMISPVEYVEDFDGEMELIDEHYEEEMEKLKRDELQLKNYSELQSNIVLLCHQTALAAMSSFITISHPQLVQRLQDNPGDTEAVDEMAQILKDLDVQKQLDTLSVKILTTIYKYYPILQTTNNRLLNKDNNG